jgi:hypothetical protein
MITQLGTIVGNHHLEAPMSSQALRSWIHGLTALSIFTVAGCTSDPVDRVSAPVSPGTNALSAQQSYISVASAVATSKDAISGTITNSVPGFPARVVVTPSGRCHFFGYPNVTLFTGDVSGTVTFEEHVNAPCDLTDVVGNGPISGVVIWNGRTGSISGEWTTNCTPDASQVVGLSCDGVMNVRGSGGLEGVHFKFNWGPGWFPFPYSGTASSD